MAWNGLTILAVVPARGGSKGIPRKNLCRVGGLSLIAHTANTIQDLPWIDYAVLSTDSQEMAEEGKRFGLSVPFMRPAELSGDLSNSVDMWRHAWLASETHTGRRFDCSILLQPTTPLRMPKEVEHTVRTLLEGPYQAAATISKTPGHFTPEKTLMLDRNGKLRFYMKDGAQYSLRQTIPDYYHRNGLCYAVKRSTLIDKGHIIEEDCAGVVIDRYIANIDDPIDLEWADFLYRKYYT